MGVSGGEIALTPGGRFAELMHRAPSRLLELTALYKFAAKMVGPGKKVMELWSNEGLGTWLVGKECGHCTGVEPDKGLVELATRNYPAEQTSFENGDFMAGGIGIFDAIVCLDLGSHVASDRMPTFMNQIVASLDDKGVVVLSGGVAPSGMDVGPDSWLVAQTEQYFRHVFPFNASDEIIRAGYDPASRTHIVVGCGKRRGRELS
jgi:hypothetical protein